MNAKDVQQNRDTISLCSRISDDDMRSWYFRILAYRRVGASFTALGSFDDANQNLDRAIELEDRNAELFWARARAFQLMGRVQDAINDHNRIISLAPSITLIAQAYSDIAAIYNESSRYDQAIAYQTKAIVMCEGGLPFANLKLPYLYRDRSSMWSKMGDITRSQVDSKKATELERRL